MYNETMPTMTDTLFVTELDGPTFTTWEELLIYSETLELRAIGS